MKKYMVQVKEQDLDKLTQLCRAVFYLGQTKCSFVATLNDYYLNKYIEYFKTVQNLKNDLFSSYNIPVNRSFHLDLNNLRIFYYTKEEEDA